MNTQIFKVDAEHPDKSTIGVAADIIKRGGLVAFPTETVYGLGADATDKDAAKKIYAAKGRPSDNPLIIHISAPEDAERYAYTSPLYYALARAFMPGPLTVIMPKRDTVPSEVTGGLDSVAVRCPSHAVARELIAASGVAIAAPSANISGSPSPTSAEHVTHDMNGRIDAIIDGGECEIGLESTIVKIVDNSLIMLRPGAITADALSLVCDSLEISSAVTEALKENERPLSPGMKYRHYAPKAPVSLLAGTEEAIVAFLRSAASESGSAFLVYDEDAYLLPPARTQTLGPKNAPTVQAHKLFDCLRAFDDMKSITRIYARLPEKTGIGLAVYNRLAKAAGFTVIDVATGKVGELQ